MTSKKNIDLIITDVEMPKMDGIDFFKNLQKDPKTAQIPVMVITDSVMIRESFRILGVNDFISKPIAKEELLQRVKNLFLLALQKSKYGKIFVINSDPTRAREMKIVLESYGFAVEVTSSGMDSISLALKFVPKVILIDILMKDIPAREIIRALHCFMKLHPVKAVTYTTFDPEGIGTNYTVAQIEEANNACLDVGVVQYMGRFSPQRFLEVFGEIFGGLVSNQPIPPRHVE